MTWVRIADDLPDHPKLIEAGPLAGWMWLAGLCYANKYLTDGIIPAAQVRRLADVDDPAALALQLVAVGLWEPAERGYRIHDYHDYQPSADEIRRERAAAAARQAAYRERHLAAQRNGVSNAATDAVSSGAPARPGPVNTPGPGTTPDTSPPLPPSPQAGKGGGTQTRRKRRRQSTEPEPADIPQLAPLSDHDLAVLHRACERLKSEMSEVNWTSLVGALEPMGRAEDGTLHLRAPPGRYAARVQGHLARALVDAGDSSGHVAIVEGV